MMENDNTQDNSNGNCNNDGATAAADGVDNDKIQDTDNNDNHTNKTLIKISKIVTANDGQGNNFINNHRTNNYAIIISFVVVNANITNTIIIPFFHY